MLKLKNVSKFYYNKGVIASGFNKINIEFKLGEFVAIIGESGSGKSTLLNVISGLDSYEDGEMYINGKETSHYREIDFEEYRKKYVSNIFQNFNLVNSYTVYQNIELVLLINGYKKSEVKDKVLELINRVNLNKYKNTKVSKLSGGQKQRVAIARALARDTPIIACDEPTASLDSKAAKEVIKLLKEVSKDKLVIVVTHNFSEVEDVATRVVKMHDGKIISDKTNVKNEVEDTISDNKNKSITPLNILRLGIRNTFNIIPKFLLIFIVFFFITISLLSVYASLKKNEYEESKLGNNMFFRETTDTRIVIKKLDKTPIIDDDFSLISTIPHVSNVVKYDILMDDMFDFESVDDKPSYIGGIFRDINTLNGKLDYGRMPQNDNEVVVEAYSHDYYFTEILSETISKTYYFNGDKNSFSINVVGVKYKDDESEVYLDTDVVIYGSKYLQEEYMKKVNRSHSTITVNLNGKNYTEYMGNTFTLNSNNKVPSGCIYVSENMDYACKDYSCKNKSLSINISNLYYNEKHNFKICKVYTKKTFKSLTGISEEDYAFGRMFINTNDYNKMFNKESYQSSVMVDSIDNVDEVASKLENLGYKTLQIRKTLVNASAEARKVLNIMKLVVIILLVVTLFFISYFVIKIILKSRNVYYSTLRILGANFRHIKKILDIELFINSTLAYLVYIGLVMLVKYKVIYIKFISDSLEYLKISDYAIMYVILVVMSYLISTRYASKIFKSSAMKTYREEV